MSSTPVVSFFLYTSRNSSNANPSITFCAVVTPPPPFFTLVHDNILGVAHYDSYISMFARYDLDTYSRVVAPFFKII